MNGTKIIASTENVYYIEAASIRQLANLFKSVWSLSQKFGHILRLKFLGNCLKLQFNLATEVSYSTAWSLINENMGNKKNESLQWPLKIKVNLVSVKANGV